MNGLGRKGTYGLTADVGMPDFVLEFHDRRPEWVFIGDLDVDLVYASLVLRPGWAFERALQVCQVLPVADSIRLDFCESV